MSDKLKSEVPVTRRTFFRNGARLAAMSGLGALAGVLANRSQAKGYVWQIDPA